MVLYGTISSNVMNLLNLFMSFPHINFGTFPGTPVLAKDLVARIAFEGQKIQLMASGSDPDRCRSFRHGSVIDVDVSENRVYP